MHHVVCISVSTKRNSAPNFLKVKMLNGVRFNVCTTGMTSVCFPQHQMYSSGARQLQSHQVIPKFTVVPSSATPKKYTNRYKRSLKHADLYNLCGQRFLTKHFLFQSKYCHTTISHQGMISREPRCLVRYDIKMQIRRSFQSELNYVPILVCTCEITQAMFSYGYIG